MSTANVFDGLVLVSADALAARCSTTVKGLPPLVRAGLLPPPLKKVGRGGKRWWSALQVEDHLRRLGQANGNEAAPITATATAT